MHSWDIDSKLLLSDDTKVAFDSYGVLVIRGALHGLSLAVFQDLLAEYLSVLEHLIAQNAPEIQANPGLVPMAARGLVHHSLLSEHLFHNSVGIIDRLAVIVQGSRLHNILRMLLGDHVIMLDEYSTLRYKDPAKVEGFLPFHQDAHPNGPSTVFPKVLTCFTPFSDTGTSRPGIEFVPQIIPDIIDLSPQPRTQFTALEVDDLLVQKRWGNMLTAPRLHVGDIVLMNGMTIHRSQPAPVSWKPRGSADLRFIAASPVPSKYVNSKGIDLSSGARISLV